VLSFYASISAAWRCHGAADGHTVEANTEDTALAARNMGAARPAARIGESRKRPPSREQHRSRLKEKTMTTPAPAFAHQEKDSVYYTLCTSTELFLRNDGHALLVIGVDEQLTDEDDVVKLRAASVELSRRQNVTVILTQNASYPETQSLEVFRQGYVEGEAVKTFGKDMEFRFSAWRAGDDGAWREWEVGCEPVPKPRKKECSCRGCEVHADVDF
jgi:hypothetical protein